MFKKIISLFLAALLLASLAPPAFAATQTADFEGLGYDNGQQIPETVSLDGFRFATSTHEGMDYRIGEGANDSAGLLSHYTNDPIAWVEFRREDNAAFALTSIYFDNTGYPGTATACEIQGYYNETQVETMSDVPLADAGTISFTGWDQVDRVRIVATAGSSLDIAAVFDDIVYEIVSSSILPYMDILLPLTLAEGATAAIPNTLLKAEVNDGEASSLAYTVTTAPAHGRLEDADNPGVSLTTFTQGFVDSGKLRYVHDDSDTNSDSFGFSVTDGTYTLANQTFSIIITTVYDPELPEGAVIATFDSLPYDNAYHIAYTMPVEGFLFQNPDNTGMNYYTSGAQENTPGLVPYNSARIPVLTIVRSDASDFTLYSIYVDGHNGWGSDTYKFEGFLDGGLVYTKDNVNISVAGPVSFDEWTGDIDELRITAITGGSPHVMAYFDNIVYKPGAVSPVPYVALNLPVTVGEGGTATITSSALQAADSDSEVSALIYTVTTAPAHGQLENADDPGVAISTFTQGTIDGGKLRYVHDHSDTLSDSFVFSLSDGVNEVTNQPFNIIVTPVYDDPVPPGATVATFDSLGYISGLHIDYTTPVEGFLFRTSEDLGMIYYPNIGQDNTPGLTPKISSGGAAATLSITRSGGTPFNLLTMYLYDIGMGSSEYTFEGYAGGTKLYTKENVNVTSKVKVAFDWDGVDEVRVIAQGATPNIRAYFDNIVYEANAAPTDIALSPATVAEDAASGTVIGTFSTTDADAGDTFTYGLVSGEGDTDNGLFTIDGDSLKLGSTPLDYETKSSLSIRVRTADAAGATYEKTLAVAVTDAYEMLCVTVNSPLSLPEDAAATTIGSGNLTTTVNAGLAAAYTLTAIPAQGTLYNDGIALSLSGTFTQADIDGNKLTYAPNANASGSDSFSFSVSDGTNSVTGTFSISITAINDAPVLTPAAPSLTGISANQTDNAGQTVASFLVTSISDVDSAAQEGIAVTSTASGNGAWQYSIDSGSTWTSVGAVSAGAALLLRDTDLMRFVPNGADATTASITYRAWDRTSGTQGGTADTTTNGGTTAYSTATDTAGIAVTAAPALVTSVNVPANGAYGVGQALDFTVNFDKAVTVDATGGTPRLALTIGVTTVYANYLSGSGSTALAFRYTVALFQTDSDGITVGALSANGGTIHSAGVDANLTLNNVPSTAGVRVDGTAPTIYSAAVPVNRTYAQGQTLTFLVYFDEAVTVNTAGGTPRLALTVGAETAYAAYAGGSGTTGLIFQYTVAAGQADSDGIAIGALTANGGTIRDAAGNDAHLTLNGIPTTAGILVDGIAPSVSAVTPSGTGVSIALDELSVTFDEAMNTAAGTAALNNGATLSSPVWSNGNKTLTYTLAGLAYSTTYTLTLTNFADAAGNVMATNTANQFTTVIAYTITASAGAGGGISPSGNVTVAGNGSRTFTITAQENFAIVSVLVDGDDQGAISSYTFDNVTGNHTIAANFAPVYALTIAAGAGGTANSAANGSYVEGAIVPIAASPAPGFQFVRWTATAGVLANANAASTTFTMPAGTATVTAVFAANAGDPYVQETYIVNGDGQVTVDLTHGSSTLSASQMDRLILLNQQEPVVVNGEGYTITFPKGSLQLTGATRDYNLGLAFNMGANYAAIRSAAGDELVLMLHFSHSGPLPGEAQVRVYVGAQYAGQRLHYCYYNPQTGELEYLQIVTVDAGGYATVTQSRCSSYAFILYDGVIGLPQTGGSFGVPWGLLWSAALAALLCLLRKKKKARR